MEENNTGIDIDISESVDGNTVDNEERLFEILEDNFFISLSLLS